MKTCRKAGFSLVEIMVSILILVVLALGGSAVLYQTGGDIQVVGNKRVALELAKIEMEGLLAANYDTLRARAVAADPEILSRTEIHNGVSISIILTNRLAPGGILGNEYIALDVNAVYGAADESVLLHANKTISP